MGYISISSVNVIRPLKLYQNHHPVAHSKLSPRNTLADNVTSMPDSSTQKSPALQDLSDRLSNTLQQHSGYKRGGRGKKVVESAIPLVNTLGGEETGSAKGTTTITIRVTQAEKRELKRLAETEGITLTDYLKQRIIKYHRLKTDTPVVNKDTYRILSNIRRDLLRIAKGIEAIAPGVEMDTKTNTPIWAIAFHKHLKRLHKVIGQVQADLVRDNS